MSITEPEMSSIKKSRQICKTVADVVQLTVQSQTRAMAKSTKEKATTESVRALMREDCKALGILDIDRDLPPVVHVAGTKGKGSTCALLESILRHGRLRTGLFTSPHLVDIRERIRINGRLLAEDVFENHLMETYHLLGPERMENIGFFQFVTLAALRIFARTTPKREDIDVLILETGIGGRLDFTNAFDRPLCCAITKIDYDHMEILGNTLALIATEKAGIIKKHVKVYTSSTQVEEALPIIIRVAREMDAPVEIVPPLHISENELGIGGGFPQLENAGLAVAMAKHVYSILAPGLPIPQETIDVGLRRCRFPGRAQIESGGDGIRLYLDGAHTPLSVDYASKWFRLSAQRSEGMALVFHCSPDRDGKGMLTTIMKNVPDLTHAFFMPPTSGLNAGSAKYHEELASIWVGLNSAHSAIVFKDGPVAFKQYVLEEHKKSPGFQNIFVVGSFYIVGDALKYWAENWDVEKFFSSD